MNWVTSGSENYIYNSFIVSKIIQCVIIIEGLSVLHERECYGLLKVQGYCGFASSES